MKKFSLIICLLITYTAFGQWKQVGGIALDVGAPSTYTNSHPIYQKMVFNPVTNEPYIISLDYTTTNGTPNRPTVVRFDGNNWVAVGNAQFTPAEAEGIDMAIHPTTGEPYVSFYDNTGSGNGGVSVMKFDGSSWVLEGSRGFYEPQHNFFSSGTNGATKVATKTHIDVSSHGPVVCFSGKDGGGSGIGVMFPDQGSATGWRLAGSQNGSLLYNYSFTGTSGVSEESSGRFYVNKITGIPVFIAYDLINSGCAVVQAQRYSNPGTYGSAGIGSSYTSLSRLNISASLQRVGFYENETAQGFHVMSLSSGSWVDGAHVPITGGDSVDFQINGTSAYTTSKSLSTSLNTVTISTNRFAPDGTTSTEGSYDIVRNYPIMGVAGQSSQGFLDRTKLAFQEVAGRPSVLFTEFTDDANKNINFIVYERTENTPPVVLNPILAQTAYEDQTFSFQFSEDVFSDDDILNNDDLIYSAKLSNGLDFPSWLSFDPMSRTFSGIPVLSDVGSTITVRLKADDGLSGVASIDFDITVVGTNDPPYLNPALGGVLAFPSVNQGDFTISFSPRPFLDEEDGFQMTHEVSYPDGSPVSWVTIYQGTLGLTGRARQQDVGTTTLRLTATDSGNESVSALFDITVIDVNISPSVHTSIPKQYTIAGEYFEYQIPENAFLDEDGDPLSYSAQLYNLINWATFDPQTRTISGTPQLEHVRNTTVSISVIDGGTKAAKSNFDIEVTAPIVWDGNSWSPSAPAETDHVLLSGNYSTSIEGVFLCENLILDAGVDLVVDGNETLIVNGDITNNGHMLVESGSSLITFSGNTVTGNDIEIRRTTRYGDGKYSFVGIPVEQNVNITDTDLGSNVYRYDESQPYSPDHGLARWIPMTGELIPGVGYTQAFKQGLIFSGVPNTGQVVVNGSFNGTYNDGVNESTEGWNLIANPYAAAIDVASFLSSNTNIEGAVYIWDDNGSTIVRGSNSDYIVANGAVATNTTPAGGQSRYNQQLGSAQGFFVKLMSDTDTNISFDETLRSIGGNSDDNFFRKTEEAPSYVRVNLTNDEGLFKQTILGWMNDISDIEVDRRFDARVFNSNADYSIYTFKAEQPLAIQGLTYAKEEVLMGINVGVEGSYQLHIEKGNYNGESLYLKDNLEGNIFDLLNGAYDFTTKSGQIEGRFSILTKSEVLSLEESKSKIYTAQKTLHIEALESHLVEYQLYNLSGKHVMSILSNGATKVDLSFLTNGIYLVSDGIETKKVVLK